jgi:hypothetical protein
VGQPLGDGNGEGCRLSRAGLGEADQVSSGERRGDDRGLDRRRVLEAHEADAAQDRLTEAQRFEIFIGGFNGVLWDGQRLHGSCL